MGGPNEVNEWIIKIERIFAILGCQGCEKITFVEFILDVIVDHWWITTKPRIYLTPESVTWEMFKKVFLNKYFSQAARAKKTMEFMKLKQGNTKVDKYEQDLLNFLVLLLIWSLIRLIR